MQLRGSSKNARTTNSLFALRIGLATKRPVSWFSHFRRERKAKSHPPFSKSIFRSVFTFSLKFYNTALHAPYSRDASRAAPSAVYRIANVSRIILLFSHLFFTSRRPERGEKAPKPTRAPAAAHQRKSQRPQANDAVSATHAGRIAFSLIGIQRATRGRLFFALFGGLAENAPKAKK